MKKRAKKAKPAAKWWATVHVSATTGKPACVNVVHRREEPTLSAHCEESGCVVVGDVVVVPLRRSPR